MTRVIDPLLLITGMHRSGTSFVVRAFNLMGIYLGEPMDLISDEWRPSKENLRGHWENRKFLNFFDNTLKLNNSSWDNPSENFTKIKKSAFTSLIKKLMSHNSLGWGIKDPRILLLHNLLSNLDITFVTIGIFRNPLEVAESLKKRNNFEYSKSLNLWKIYNEKLLSIIEKDPNSFLLDFNWPKKRLLDEILLIGKIVFILIKNGF